MEQAWLGNAKILLKPLLHMKVFLPWARYGQNTPGGGGELQGFVIECWIKVM